MLRAVLLCFCLLFTPTLTLADMPQAGTVVPDLTAFTDPAMSTFEYVGEGRPTLQIIIAPTDDFNLSVTVENTGFLDDSVYGQLTRYVTRFDGDGWQVLSVEVLVSCYRSETRDWQVGPCP